MNDKSNSEIPDDILDLAKDIENKRELAKKKKLQEETEERRRRETERGERLKDGIHYARHILSWAMTFAQSEKAKELFAFKQKLGYPTFLYIFSGRINDWTYGFTVYPDRLEWWRAGPGSRHIPVRNPEQLAQDLPTSFLEKASRSIRDGLVWKEIREDIGNYERFFKLTHKL